MLDALTPVPEALLLPLRKSPVEVTGLQQVHGSRSTPVSNFTDHNPLRKVTDGMPVLCEPSELHSDLTSKPADPIDEAKAEEGMGTTEVDLKTTEPLQSIEPLLILSSFSFLLCVLIFKLWSLDHALHTLW